MKDESTTSDKITAVQPNQATTQKPLDRGDQIQKNKVEEEKLKSASMAGKHTVVYYKESEAAPRLWSSVVISPEKAVNGVIDSKGEMNIYVFKSKEKIPMRHDAKDAVLRPGKREDSWRIQDKKEIRKDEAVARRDSAEDTVQKRSSLFRHDNKSSKENSNELTEETKPSKKNDREKYTEQFKKDSRNRNKRERDVKDLNHKGEAIKNRNKRSEKSSSRTEKRIDDFPEKQRKGNMKEKRKGKILETSKKSIGDYISKSSAREKTRHDETRISTKGKEIIKDESSITEPAMTKIELKSKISPREVLTKIQSPRDNRSPRGSGKGQKKRSPREGNKKSPREKRSDDRCKPRERRNKKKRSTRRYTDTPEKNPITEDVQTSKNEDAVQPMKAEVNAEELAKIATSVVNKIVFEAMKIVKGSFQVNQETKETEELQLEQAASIVLKHVFYIVCYKWKLYHSHIQDVQQNETGDMGANDEMHKDEDTGKVEPNSEEVVVDNENTIEESKRATVNSNENTIEESDSATVNTNENTIEEPDSATFYTNENTIEESDSATVNTNENTIEESDSATVNSNENTIEESDSATGIYKDLPIAKVEPEHVEEIRVQTDENGPDNASLSSDDETLTEEIVYQVVNTTTSADHLNAISYSKAPDKKLSHNTPVGKISEPNVHFKENKTLRSTKSEVMTSSTGGSTQLSHGIEAQNNSEGNISHGTACRLKATQQDLPKRKVEIPTIDIATNEKGSGESCEAGTSKQETAISVENQIV